MRALSATTRRAATEKDKRCRRPRAVPDAASDDAGFDDLLQVLGEQLGEATQSADPRSCRKLKNVTFEYEPDRTAVHDMADDDGYSLASEKKDGKRITRSTVNRAIKALVGYKWVEQLGNGMIQLNVRLWFHGNSNAQHAVQHDRDPEAFPNGIGPDVHQEELDLDFTENPH